MTKKTVVKRFTKEGKQALKNFRYPEQNPDLSSSDPKKRRKALDRLAQGGKGPLPPDLVKRARRGDFAK